MSITFSITSDNPDQMLHDLQRVFPSLVAGTALPKMQEEPDNAAKPQADVKDGEIIDPPKERKPRTKKAEPETVEGKAATTEESTAEVPDIDTVREKLKALGKIDGGHDKVFELLGKYGAKNASTVPEDKRAEVIAAIEAILGAK